MSHREYVRPHPAIVDHDLTEYDCAPNELLAKPLGPDPWDQWVCGACGRIDENQPRVCACGWINYGHGGTAA